MWGIGHRADRRTDEVFRYLSRLQIKVPRELRKTSRSPSSKKVPVKVAHALARKYATSVSPKILAWAARQAALLSPTVSSFDSVRGALTRASFIRRLDEIFDFAGSSLVLSGKYPNYRASRVNLLSLSAAQAASQSSQYHALLKRIQAGTIQLQAKEDPYFVGAALGVSPGALRNINGSRRIDTMLGNHRFARLTISPPQPLKYRHEVFRLPKGRAIVWVHPDDKGRVGAGYGWCVSDTPYWRNKLQFAVVGPENRPKALITMKLKLVGRSGVVEGDGNRFVRVAPNGRAFVDLRAISKEGGGIQWGELKGLYNQINPDEPYRSDIRKWVAKQPFGAFRTGAGNDWIKVLVTKDDIPETRKMLRLAGGHPTLMSLADAVPRKVAADLFGGDLGSWLRSPVAPLVLATMDPLQVKKIAPSLPAVLRGERFRRALKTTPKEMKRDFIVDYSLAKRAGVPLPTSQVKDFRALLAKTRRASFRVSLRQALNMIKASEGAKVEKLGAPGPLQSLRLGGPITEAEWTAMWKVFDQRPAFIPDSFWVRATGSRDEAVLSLLSNLLLAATENPRGKRTTRLMREQSIAIGKVAGLAVGIGEGDPEPGGWGDEEVDPVGEPYGDWEPPTRGMQVAGEEGFHCLACTGLAGASQKEQDRGAIPPSVAIGLFYPAVFDAWEIRPWYFDFSELGAMWWTAREGTMWSEYLDERMDDMAHTAFEEEGFFGELEPLAKTPVKEYLDAQRAGDLAGGWVPGRQDRTFKTILKSAVNPVSKLRALALAGAWPAE